MDAALLARIRSAVRDTPGVVAAWVFGSVARGEATEHSDLDVAVLLRQGSDLMVLLDLAAQLEMAAERPVDVVRLSLGNVILAHEVLRDGVLVVDRDREARIDFESEAMVRYLDFRPIWERSQRGWLEGWRRSVRELQ